MTRHDLKTRLCLKILLVKMVHHHHQCLMKSKFQQNVLTSVCKIWFFWLQRFNRLFIQPDIASLNYYCRDLLIQQLMKEINELKQELARIKGEVSTSYK